MTAWLATTLRGICMGVADIIPGVSGGTLALILGIYERFIAAVSAVGPGMFLALFKRELWTRLRAGLTDPKAVGDDEIGTYAGHILFLAFLLVGIGGAIAVGAKFLPTLLNLYPAPMKGFFFGLVLASVKIPFRMMNRRGTPQILVAVVFALATWMFVGLQLDSSERARGQVVLSLAEAPAAPLAIPRAGLVLMTATHGGESEKREVVFAPDTDLTMPAGQRELTVPVSARMAGAVTNIPAGALTIVHGGPPGLSVRQDAPMTGGTNPSMAWIFIAGCIAISAMVLPGISGSFILLMFGLYHYMTFTLRSLLYDRDPDALGVVVVFVAALITGIATFSRLLRWLFERHHDATLAALVGLMCGSLRKIWPFVATGADGVDVNVLPAGLDALVWTTVGTFLAGAAVVIVLERAGALKKPAEV